MLSRANIEWNLPSQFETQLFRVRGKHWVTHRLQAVQCFLPGKSMLILLQVFFFIKTFASRSDLGASCASPWLPPGWYPIFFVVVVLEFTLLPKWQQLLLAQPTTTFSTNCSITTFPRSLFPILMCQKQIHFLFLSSLLSLMKSILGAQGIQKKCNCNSKVDNYVKRMHFAATKHLENLPGSTATLRKVCAKESLVSKSRCKVCVKHVSPKIFCVAIDE